MKRALVLLTLAAAVLPAAAVGVWGGAPDTAHPGVGAMYYDFQGTGVPIADGLICSGAYAGPSKDGRYDVFLTAGHCMPPPFINVSDLYVSFDADGRDGVANAIQVVGFSQMPGFGRDLGDLKDLGVLLLPAGSVGSGIPAVELPAAGYLDALKAAGTLTFRIADVVGYGVVPDWDSPGPTTFSFDGVRRAGTSIITGLTKSMLLYNQQRHGIGTGSGVCFGDSGSPQFEQGTLRVLSITSGGNGQCNANNSNYRVDTPQARAFLGQFVPLP